MKSTKAIPDRWLEYNACGRVVEGTRLICFKVPLRKEVQVKEPSITQLWDIPSVLAEIPRLSAVIDLTNTARYYNPNEFLAAKVLHKKIFMPGRVVPPESKVKEFMDAVDEFLGRDCDSLVGVHCTHGLNRTGYMVCRYMRDRLGIAGPEAIKRFETARGYKIERDIYINGILKKKSAPEHEGKEPNYSRNERNQFENSQSENSNKVFNQVTDVDDQPIEYNHHRGGMRRVNNIPSRNRQFEANRDRRDRYNDESYASQPSFANRGDMRSNYNPGPSRTFNRDNFNRQHNNNLRNNYDGPNHSRSNRNQFENSHNKLFHEVSDVNNQPNGYNYHRGGIRRFNNMPSRNRQFEASSDRRGNYNDESFASQPPFANRGDMQSNYDQGPSRSFNNNDVNRQYNNISRNNDDRYDSRSTNDRFTPHNRGPHNFRVHNRRNYND